MLRYDNLRKSNLIPIDNLGHHHFNTNYSSGSEKTCRVYIKDHINILIAHGGSTLYKVPQCHTSVVSTKEIVSIKGELREQLDNSNTKRRTRLNRIKDTCVVKRFFSLWEISSW